MADVDIFAHIPDKPASHGVDIFAHIPTEGGQPLPFNPQEGATSAQLNAMDPTIPRPGPIAPPAADERGILRRGFDYALTQGGRFSPDVAKHMLANDALDLVSSIPMSAPVGAGLMGANAVAKTASTAGKAASGAVHVGTELVGNLATHTGGESIRQAFAAGQAGGEAAEAFLSSLRGSAAPEEVVDIAKSALAKIRDARNVEYMSGMVDVTKDAKQLSFDGVESAISKIRGAAEYKGKAVNPEAVARLKEVQNAISEWKAGEPADFHTVQGFDALKQRIGAVLEQTTPHTKASAVVGNAYNAVRDEIAKQAPGYAKVMKDYEEASSAIRDMEGALSLKDTWARKSTTEAALRKLQSVMRNNVQTAYGNRLRMAQSLDEASGGMLMPSLAGQSLSSVTPRGLGNVMAGASAIGSLAHPGVAATLPLQSPRLVGEAAYGLGSLPRIFRRYATSAADAIRTPFQ